MSGQSEWVKTIINRRVSFYCSFKAVKKIEKIEEEDESVKANNQKDTYLL